MTPDSNELLALVATWMMQHSIPTGHGDTLDDLLNQIAGSKVAPDGAARTFDIRGQKVTLSTAIDCELAAILETAPPSDDVRSALADELDRLKRLEETTDDGEPDNMGESWHNYAGHFIDNHEVITAALRLAPVSAPAVGVTREAIAQISALSELDDTQDHDVNFILGQLRLQKTNERQEAIISFRKQLIVAAATYGMQAALSPAPDATVSATKSDTCHYLNAIRVRLETLYAASKNNPRLREQLSDEVDWIDAQLTSHQDVGTEATVSARDAVIEECAKIAEIIGPSESPIGIPSMSTHDLRVLIVKAIRSLASGARP